jgi:hypothetical protein
VRKAERAWFLFEGEESEAWGINGARPHFLYENVLFLNKWGQAPFSRPHLFAYLFAVAPFIRWGKSNAFLNYIALAFFLSNK